MNDIIDKLIKTRCRLMLREPFYGHIAMSMIWTLDEKDQLKHKTMAVRVKESGDVECIYSPSFIKDHSIKQLYFTVQHEIEHIVRMHCVHYLNYDPDIYNIACDMVVNGKKSNLNIGYKDDKNIIELPLNGNIVYIPEDWKAGQTVKYYYDKLMKKEESNASTLDDHSLWSDSSSVDEVRQVVKGLVTQALSQSKGVVPNHLEEDIASLNKPLVNWKSQLRLAMGECVGATKKSFSRRNRRIDTFGLPGISHRKASEITIIVDVSGSTFGLMGQFFGEIDYISYKHKVNILQWDTSFQGYSRYHRGDWKKFKVRGFGGTDMASPIQWLMDNRLITDLQIMLTDGYCNYIEASCIVFPIITLVTDSSGLVPTYGKVIKVLL